MTSNKPSIRAATAADGAAVAAIYAPYVLETAITFETVPPDAAEMSERIVQTTKTHPWLIAQIESQVAGFAYASKHSLRPGYRFTFDLTVYVGRHFHGRRVGRALYEVLLNTARAQGFRSAFAEIVLPHAASVRLHEEMGFREIGVHKDIGFKLGRWHDIGYWRLGLSEAAPPFEDPIPFDAFARLPAFQGLIEG